MSLLLVPVLIVVALAVILGRRSPETRARVLRRSGLALMALFTVFITLFIAGEALVDPGGWEGVGMIASWVLPIAGLAALAWYRPGAATIVLAVLTGVIVLVSVWYALDSGGWRSFEDDIGPVRAVATFVVQAPLALLGWKRPRAAGTLLVIVGVVPVLISGLGTQGWGVAAGSLFALSSPGVVSGILYLLAAHFEKRAQMDAAV
jgi:hypothetical protein